MEMIKLNIVTVMLFITFINHAQGQTDERQRYKSKIATYSKTKNTGSILLFSGLISSVVGIAFVASSLSGNEKDVYGEPVIDETQLKIGTYAMGFGVDLIIGGVILKSVGNRKVKQYQEKLNNLSAGIRINPEVKGFAMVYRF